MSKKEAIQAADYDEEMTVTMELEDGESVTCAIITILTVNEKDYIILLPLDEKGENEDGEVWIYGYKEDESDPNAEPELFFIEDEDEYDAVSDRRKLQGFQIIFQLCPKNRLSVLSLYHSFTGKIQGFFCPRYCHIKQPPLFFQFHS